MTLRVHLLGQFELLADDRPLRLVSRPAQALLAYLVIHAGMAQRRERLAGLLWPDADETNARGYLRQGLWRIRKTLADGGLCWGDYLLINDLSLTFRAESDYWLDAQQLLRPTQGATPDELVGVVRLYRGELLPGIYEDWVGPERERLAAAFHQTIGLLLDGLIHDHRWREAIDWAEEWIRLGDWPEPAYRGLMQAHAGLGDRAMVIAAYDRCAAALDREYGAAPSPETQHLYARLRQASADIGDIVATPERSEIDGALPFLQQPGPVDDRRPVFVARAEELARLGHYLDRALAGQGLVAFVTGEAGSGKTALIHEFARRSLAAQPDLLAVSGCCNANTGIGDPYLPFREVIDMLTGDIAGHWAAGTIDTHQAQQLWHGLPLAVRALTETAPDLLDTFIHGQSLLSRVRSRSPDDEACLTRLDELLRRRTDLPRLPATQQGDLFEQYTRLIQTIAQRAPLLLIIDDLHWADLGSISLLFHLGRHLAGHRVLVIGTYRPEEVMLGREGARHPLASVVNELQRQFGLNHVDLEQAAGQDFVDALLDSEPNELGPTFRQMLYTLTRGNPLFTIELLRGMQERGDLLQDVKGRWIPGTSLDWDTLPARVEAVIAERIGRLPPELQQTLQVAGVEGELFTAEVVARALGLPAREVFVSLNDRLDRQHQLIRAHSIVRQDGHSVSAFRFRHILFQRFIYSGLNAVERVHLHERVGLALESLYADQPVTLSVATQLARHFEAAGVTERAVHYLGEAGQQAVRLSAYQEGATHVLRGLELLATLPPAAARDEQELALQLSLAIARQGLYGSQPLSVQASWARARELCQRRDDPYHLAQILGGLVVHYYVRGQPQLAYQTAMESLAAAERTGDPLLVALSRWYLGLVLFYRAEYLAARREFACMIDYYRPQHRDRLVAIRGSDAGLGALAYDACCLLLLGYPEQAARRSEETLATAREFNHYFTLADVLTYAGGMFNETRREAEALAGISDELVRLLNRGWYASWSDAAAYFRGVALVMLGKPDEGIAQLRQTLDLTRLNGVHLYDPGIYRALAEGYAALGRVDDGLAAVCEGLLLAEEFDAHMWDPALLRLRAALLRHVGQESEAEASLKAAISAAQSQQARLFELRAMTDLARLWADRGRIAEAHAALTETYAWFSEGFDTPDLLQARALLQELAGQL